MSRRRKADTASNGTSNGQIRCAIYTRKSSEEGLDQEFNSLDAQRESAEAFIPEFTLRITQAWSNLTAGLREVWARFQNWLSDRFLEVMGMFDETLDVQAAQALGREQLQSQVDDIERSRREAIAEAQRRAELSDEERQKELEQELKAIEDARKDALDRIGKERDEPHTSPAVLHDAVDDAGTRDASGLVRLHRRKSKRGERRSIEPTDAAERADPQQSISVDDDAPDVVVLEAVFGRVGGERHAVVLGQSAFRAEPDGVMLVRDDGSHRAAGEAFLDGEEFQRLAVVAGDAVAVGPEPQVAAAIFKDSADEGADRHFRHGR